MPIPRSTLLLLSLVVFVLVAVPTARGAAKVNTLSVQYNTEVQEQPSTQVTPPSPPARHPRATHWRAFRALAGGDAGTALALSRQLATLGDPLAPEIKARALELRGDYPAAVGVWKQFGSADALLRVAKAATEAGQLDAALDALDAARELDPTGESAGRLSQFLWKKKQDPAAAEAVLRRALTELPVSTYRPYNWQRLAELLAEQNRWAEAAEAYQNLIATANLMYPQDQIYDEYYSEMAWAYHMSGRPEEGLEAIQQAMGVTSAAPRVSVLERAGPIYEAAGQTQKAIAAYRQILTHHPNDTAAQEALDRLTNDQ